jgi:DNA polymerase
MRCPNVARIAAHLRERQARVVDFALLGERTAGKAGRPAIVSGVDVHIDFETFSRLDIKTTGAYRYAEDASTEILICCYAIGNGEVRTWLPREQPQIPHDLAEAVRKGARMFAHNAQFERAIWQCIVVRRHGGPRTTVKQWRCTAVLSSQAGLPRALEKACIAVGTDHRKDKEGTRLIRMFCQPRKPTKKDPRTRIYPAHEPGEFRKFINYCRDDVLAERDLHRVLPPLCPQDVSLFALDFTINERGLPFDTDMVVAAIPVVEQLQAMAVQRVEELTGGIAPTQVEKLRAWLSDHGCDVPNLQKETLNRAVIDPALNEEVREVIRLRLEAGLVSTKKLYAMRRVCSPRDGRARGTIMFYGAHTGRWSGKLIQPHNFTRGRLKPKQQLLVFEALAKMTADMFACIWDQPISVISQCMRGFIKAHKGKRLLVVDYAAIEARVLAWLAQERWLLEAFMRGEDVYKIMASMVFGIPVEQIAKDGPERFIGKQLTLGCGYQLGGDRFVEYCAATGTHIEPEAAHRYVKTYRAKNPRIKQYWYDTERAAIAAVQTGQRTNVRNVGFEVVGRWLTVILPSGRRLYYLDPKVQPVMKFGEPSLQLTYKTENLAGQMVRIATYGGKLVENIVQAVARDFMANGMRQAEARGYPIIGTVHDELISERPEGEGTVEELEHAVCVLPDWGTGCPINAEGFETHRYRKG